MKEKISFLKLVVVLLALIAIIAVLANSKMAISSGDLVSVIHQILALLP